MLRTTTPATLADLDALPDDGNRYELIDGEVLVTPAPGGPHNELADEIRLLLRNAAPEGFVVLTGYQLWPQEERRMIPDVSVLRADRYRFREALEAPELVVEVLSPSWPDYDLYQKLHAYAEFGVGHYWVAEPTGPALADLVLVEGRYELAGEASGDEAMQMSEPFPVVAVPSELRRYQPIDSALAASIDLPAAVRTALDDQC